MKRILLLSGKGGTGKTTVSSALIRLSQAKAVADCDVDAPNLHLVLQEKEKAQVCAQTCAFSFSCSTRCRLGASTSQSATAFACDSRISAEETVVLPVPPFPLSKRIRFIGSLRSFSEWQQTAPCAVGNVLPRFHFVQAVLPALRRMGWCPAPSADARHRSVPAAHTAESAY